MKKVAPLFPVLFIAVVSIIFFISGSGCANIIPPGGGPRDSLPPSLVSVTPRDSATNVSAKKITFTFDEFVEVQGIQENVLVSPTPQNAPFIDWKLRTVTVKLRDTLEPNTTYSINFGSAIKDINEGNILKDFTYVFSTGNTVDQFTVSGKVTLAETGKVDTTLIVVLHKNLDDSAVVNDRPRYITRLDGKGNFTFRNLPSGTFAMYALPNDYSRRYDDKTKPFAFADKPIVLTASTPSVTLYAYAEKQKDEPGVEPGRPAIRPAGRGATENKALTISTNLEGDKFDITENLVLNLSRKIARFDSSKVVLTNKQLEPLKNYTIIADTNQTRFTFRSVWPPNTAFNVIIAKDAFADSAGITIAKNDTLKFTTKREEEYGSIKLRFNNLDFTKNPVLQIVESDRVKESILLTQRDWSRKYFKPGEYEMRILFDANKNGKWDAGEFFGKHRQPEVVKFLDTKLSVRANWDNEKEITL